MTVSLRSGMMPKGSRGVKCGAVDPWVRRRESEADLAFGSSKHDAARAAFQGARPMRAFAQYVPSRQQATAQHKYGPCERTKGSHRCRPLTVSLRSRALTLRGNERRSPARS